MTARSGTSTPTPTPTPAPAPSNSNSDPTPTSPLSSPNTTTSYTTASSTAAPSDDVRVDDAAFISDSSSVDTDDGEESDDEGESQSIPDDTPRLYRAKKELLPELKEHCRVYLEEALPQQAIALLNSLLSTRPENPEEPAYCPPPSQISLLCSIIVHPEFTTRPKEPDWPQISLQSLVYLRDLLAVLGPINAGFKEAVLFGIKAVSGPGLVADAAQDSSPDADERGLVRLSPRHGNDSVWRCGRDFFSVVGWAFNCSFLYPERWQWWTRWLDFMLHLLEMDVRERHRLDVENGLEDMPFLQGSIIASYINQRSGRTADVAMWIMKALFADGSSSSTSVFQEVWHREHKTKSRRAANKRKRDKVNLDKGEYGGYLDDESVHSSQASEPPTPQKRRLGAEPADEEILETVYIETVPFRQRLFSIISFLCYGLGDDASPTNFSNLYEKFEQRVKELPLAVFSSFINTSTSALQTDQQIEMLQGVLLLFMPAGALSPRKVDRARFEDGGISAAILERCFLPYPANTIEVEDHVKMSLLLENLLILVWKEGGKDEVGFSDNLAQAVEKGIDARWEKILKKARGRGKGVNDTEREAKAALEASDARLGWLVTAIEESMKKEDDAMSEDGGP
ncbi:hypothetical protein F4777DRAFT_588286 [Nemania sp. FL0916]|nr:hypothetical protein F4777DRAFT_588286 [Nemania sp. FL0916]